MRLPGRRATAAAPRSMHYPPVITCPVCGLRNDISLRFCRNCGLPLGAPRDPVRGTTTKRAELPSDRGAGIAALLGFLVVVLVVGGAGLMVWRGFQARADTAGAVASRTAGASVAPHATPLGSVGAATVPPTASGQPLPSSGPRASAGPGASVGPSDAAHASDGPGATDEPDATPTPKPRATPTPRATPRATPTGLDTLMSWTCKPTGIQDATKGRWRISRASWTPGFSSDRLTLTLSRMSGSAKTGTVVDAAFMSLGKAASTFDINRPAGDRAVVLTFDGPTSVGTAMAATPDLQVIESLDVRRDDDGVTHAVIGVTGSGCIRLNGPDWGDGAAPATATLVLDVRR